MATILVANFDGTNGASSYTGPDGRVWTAGGGAILTSTPVKFGSASAALRTATNVNNLATFTTPTGFAVGTGDFTIDFHLYRVGAGYGEGIIGFVQSSAVPGLYVGDDGNGSVSLRYYNEMSGTAISLVTDTVFGANNVWNHYAIQRRFSAGVYTYSLYLNGTLVQSLAGTGYDFSPPDISVGQRFVSAPATALRGYLDNLRVSDVALYTANFTPPAAAYTFPTFLAAAAADTASATADLIVVNKPVAAAPAATSTLSAALSVIALRLLASTPGAVSTLSASMVGTTSMAAQPGATATLAAPLALAVGLAGSAPASAAFVAPLALGVPLAAATTASSTASARLAALLVSAAAASATVTGTLTASKPISAAATATATLAAEFPPPILMAAGAGGSASASADVALVKRLAAPAYAVAAAPSELGLQVRIAAASAGSVFASAALGIGKDLTAQSVALAAAQAVALRGANLVALATQAAAASASALVRVTLGAGALAQSHRAARLQAGIQPGFDAYTRYVYVPATLRSVRVGPDAHPVPAGRELRTAVVASTPRSVAVLPDAIPA